MGLIQDRDEWLMAEVARGSRQCLEPLVRRHASPLLTFIRRMIASPERSEEIFQEVFLAVWEKRRTYDTSRAFKPWLYAIAVNQCRAALRRRTVSTASLPEHQLDEVRAASEPGPAETLVAVETAALVQIALAELPEVQRAVVVLRVWNGLSYFEISRALKRREGTVRSLMHRALAAIRPRLEGRAR
jgi:RNA polymerase sigma-70 factor, ECF subfamily